MFSKTNKASNHRSSPSIIGADCALTGDINSQGEVHVDGRVHGDVRCGFLVIGEQGAIIGEINAETVRVLGSVTGQISAKAVELAKTARVVGDITHDSLSVEAGAHVEGRFNRLPALKALQGPDTPPLGDQVDNSLAQALDVTTTAGNVVLLGN